MFLNLEGFDGPIDLLLELAKKQKVDLYNISILELAEQYIKYIENVKIKFRNCYRIFSYGGVDCFS